jgi:hypothetical protein
MGEQDNFYVCARAPRPSTRGRRAERWRRRIRAADLRSGGPRYSPAPSPPLVAGAPKGTPL